MASENQKLKRKLWKVFSEYIRRRDADWKGNISCCTCNKRMHWKESDAGHYIAKTAGLSIYFEEKNVHNQCTHCNRFKHGNQPKYALYLIDRYSPDILKELEWKSNQKVQIHDNEYKKLIEEYKEKIKKL